MEGRDRKVFMGQADTLAHVSPEQGLLAWNFADHHVPVHVKARAGGPCSRARSQYQTECQNRGWVTLSKVKDTNQQMREPGLGEIQVPQVSL